MSPPNAPRRKRRPAGQRGALARSAAAAAIAPRLVAILLRCRPHAAASSLPLGSSLRRARVACRIDWRRSGSSFLPSARILCELKRATTFLGFAGCRVSCRPEPCLLSAFARRTKLRDDCFLLRVIGRAIFCMMQLERCCCYMLCSS